MTDKTNSFGYCSMTLPWPTKNLLKTGVTYRRADNMAVITVKKQPAAA